MKPSYQKHGEYYGELCMVSGSFLYGSLMQTALLTGVETGPLRASMPL